MASTNLFFLLDLSGSMTQNGRLAQLNDAIPDVLGAVAKKLGQLEVESSVRIITFNSSAQYLYGTAERGESIEKVISEWKDLSAGGITRTDLAIENAAEAMHTTSLLVDGNMDNIINAPVVILFTDGMSSDASLMVEAAKKLKAKRRRKKSGKDGILCIAIGVNEAKEAELEQFASVWPTVVGKDSEGKDIVEDKKQVYMVDDAEDIVDVLSQLTVSSVYSSSTSNLEKDNVEPIRTIEEDTISGLKGSVPQSVSTDISSFGGFK